MLELAVIALAIVTGGLLVAIWLQVDARLGELEAWNDYQRAMGAGGKRPPLPEEEK